MNPSNFTQYFRKKFFFHLFNQWKLTDLAVKNMMIDSDLESSSRYVKTWKKSITKFHFSVNLYEIEKKSYDIKLFTT